MGGGRLGCADADAEPARATLRFDRVLLGRRVGRLCLAATRVRRARRACVRYAASGTLRRGLASGARSVAFSGRIGRRPLHSGRYRVVFNATDRSGNRALQRYLFITLLRG